MLREEPDAVLNGTTPASSSAFEYKLPDRWPLWLAVGFGEVIGVGFAPTLSGALFSLTVGADLLGSQIAVKKGQIQ